jgi:hypothetical protein
MLVQQGAVNFSVTDGHMAVIGFLRVQVARCQSGNAEDDADDQFWNPNVERFTSCAKTQSHCQTTKDGSPSQMVEVGHTYIHTYLAYNSGVQS